MVYLQKILSLMCIVFSLSSFASAETTFDELIDLSYENEGWYNLRLGFRNISSAQYNEALSTVSINLAINLSKRSIEELDFSDTFTLPKGMQLSRGEMFFDDGIPNGKSRQFFIKLRPFEQEVFHSICEFLGSSSGMKRLEQLESLPAQVRNIVFSKSGKAQTRTLAQKCLNVVGRAYTEELQIRLSLLGYDLGKIDGLWGKKSQRALDEYLSESASPSSTTVNSRLLRSLDLSLEKQAPPLTRWSEYAQFFDNNGNLQNAESVKFQKLNEVLRTDFSKSNIHLFSMDKITKEKLAKGYKQVDGVGVITCCSSPKYAFDPIDVDRTELSYGIKVPGNAFRMEFKFRTNGSKSFKHRTLIAQFKHHSGLVNGRQPATAPSVALYAHRNGRVSCVDFESFDSVDYDVAPVNLENGYLTDGSWHSVIMEWVPSKSRDNGMCRVIIDGDVQILKSGIRSLNFSNTVEASARIGIYRDNFYRSPSYEPDEYYQVDYNQSFEFDDLKIFARY